jgi:preprotein translocase subunit SecG
MENVVLVIHLILALGLIGIVLVQRSEGGGLGIGGGGGGARSGRPASTPMAKMTWILAIGFVITSISLTVIASRNANSDSVIERLGANAPASAEGDVPSSSGLTGDLTIPLAEDLPAEPPKAE